VQASEKTVQTPSAGFAKAFIVYVLGQGLHILLGSDTASSSDFDQVPQDSDQLLNRSIKFYNA
jgi:hypothetical protein